MIVPILQNFIDMLTSEFQLLAINFGFWKKYLLMLKIEWYASSSKQENYLTFNIIMVIFALVYLCSEDFFIFIIRFMWSNLRDHSTLGNSLCTSFSPKLSFSIFINFASHAEEFLLHRGSRYRTMS